MPGPFDGIVRDRSPETSWNAAALQNPGRVADVKATIAVLLTTRGPMTDEEIALAFAEYRRDRPWVANVTPQSLRTRRHEMHVAGTVRPTGERRLTAAGNPSQVWALTPLGEPGEPTA